MNKPFLHFDGVIRRRTYTEVIVTFAVTCTKCLARCVDFLFLCLPQNCEQSHMKIVLSLKVTLLVTVKPIKKSLTYFIHTRFSL